MSDLSRRLILILVLCASIHAAESGGAGAGLSPLGQGGRPAPAAPQGPRTAPAEPAPATIRNYEPWIKTARIGDFLVKRYPDGRTCRQEVTAMSAESVTVSFSDPLKATHLGDVLYRRRADAQKAPGSKRSLPEPELKKQSSGKIDLGGRSVEYVVHSGRSCSSALSHEGRRYELWSAIERRIAPEVPFGGVIREASAKSKPVQFANGNIEGWQQVAGEGRTIRLVNPEPPTETIFEVIAFGIGKAGGR